MAVISVYVILLVIGLVILLVSFLSGAVDFDFAGGEGGADGGSGGPSPFSIPVVASGVVTFGAGGALFEMLMVPPLLVPVLAVGFAVGGSLATFYSLTRLFTKVEATSAARPEDYVGMKAVVTVRVAPGKTGQIQVVRDGSGYVLLSALGEETLTKDTPVRIVDRVGNDFLVEPLRKGKHGGKSGKSAKREDAE